MGRIFGSFYYKIDETYSKIEPGEPWNTKKPAEMGRIGWIGSTSGQCGPNGGSNGGPMGAQGGLGLQIPGSGPQSAERAEGCYARLISILVIISIGSDDWLWVLHALRPEASADLVV